MKNQKKVWVNSIYNVYKIGSSVVSDSSFERKKKLLAKKPNFGNRLSHRLSTFVSFDALPGKLGARKSQLQKLLGSSNFLKIKNSSKILSMFPKDLHKDENEAGLQRAQTHEDKSKKRDESNRCQSPDSRKKLIIGQ